MTSDTGCFKLIHCISPVRLHSVNLQLTIIALNEWSGKHDKWNGKHDMLPPLAMDIHQKAPYIQQRYDQFLENTEDTSF